MIRNVLPLALLLVLGTPAQGQTLTAARLFEAVPFDTILAAGDAIVQSLIADYLLKVQNPGSGDAIKVISRRTTEELDVKVIESLIRSMTESLSPAEIDALFKLSQTPEGKAVMTKLPQIVGNVAARLDRDVQISVRQKLNPR